MTLPQTERSTILYFWGGREKGTSIRLSLLTCLVWSRLRGAKVRKPVLFCFFMPVCQATLFDSAFAEISIPQFPVLPTIFLERNTPPAYPGHKSEKRGRGAVCPENKNKSPTSRRYLFSYVTVTLKVPLLKLSFHLQECLCFQPSPWLVSAANAAHWVSVPSDYRMDWHYSLTFNLASSVAPFPGLPPELTSHHWSK